MSHRGSAFRAACASWAGFTPSPKGKVLPIARDEKGRCDNRPPVSRDQAARRFLFVLLIASLVLVGYVAWPIATPLLLAGVFARSEEHTSELQSLRHLVCRLLLEKKKSTIECK